MEKGFITEDEIKLYFDNNEGIRTRRETIEEYFPDSHEVITRLESLGIRWILKNIHEVVKDENFCVEIDYKVARSNSDSITTIKELVTDQQTGVTNNGLTLLPKIDQTKYIVILE